METLRPYVAAFSSRFLLMMQYRAAALAGFVTQCWFGAVRVMVLAAFYQGAEAATPASLSLSQAVTYTWLAQGLLALLPWAADPDIAAAVRSGAIGHDRLRPVDAYALWYARTAGWMTARVVPRVALMALAVGVVLPLIGQAEWAWQPPPSASAALLFILSLALATVLSCAVVMLINIIVAATLNARGVNTLAMPVVIVFSGALLPLPLFPDGIRAALFVQPLAGVLDIPNRIYSGALTDLAAWAGLGLQAFWTAALIAGGRLWLGHVMRRLEVQGG